MWKTGGLIDSLQWSLTFYYQEKNKLQLDVYTLGLKEKKKKKEAFPNKWKSLFGGELGQVIWALASKLFGGHPSTIILQANIPVNKDLHT